MLKHIKILLEAKNLLGICILFTILFTIAFLYPFKESSLELNFIVPLDKLIHVLIYVVLSFLWISYFNIVDVFHYFSINILIVLLLCFFYGIIIEVIQELFIPFRKADIFDIVSNMIGSFLGGILFWNVKNRIKS